LDALSELTGLVVASRLLEDHVPAVERVDDSDRAHQRRKLILVVVLGGVRPSLVGDTTGSVGNASALFGQLQGSALGVGEHRGLAPPHRDPRRIQHGNVGLLQAVERYDWRRGHRFSTYATWTIRHAILRGVAAQERSPRLPYALQRAVVKATAARARLEAETGVTPSVDALADATALDPRMVRDAMTAQVTTLSLDEPTANDTTIGQFLAAQSLPVEDLVIDALHDAHVLRQARELLDAEDWRLLCLRFGLDGAAQRSNALVAAAVDLSVETVRRRIVAALERLRAVLA